MDVNFTARRFRAHPDIKKYAFEEVRRLEKFFDGVTKADIILSYERGLNSIKTAELPLELQEKLGYAAAGGAKAGTNTAAGWAKREMAKLDTTRMKALSRELEQRWGGVRRRACRRWG